MIELIERLDKASGPDRDIDGDIAFALGIYPPEWRRGVKAGGAQNIWFNHAYPVETHNR